MYNLFSLWDADVTHADVRRNNFDMICDGFAEAIVWLLDEVEGVSFRKDRKIMRRNYLAIVGSNFKEVLSNDTGAHKFYKDFLSKQEFKPLMAKLRAARPPQKEWYLPDANNNGYLKFDIHYAKPTKYDDMPMPPGFYKQCNKYIYENCGDRGARRRRRWWAASYQSYCPPMRGSECVSDKCMCPTGQCAYQATTGHYCKGK